MQSQSVYGKRRRRISAAPSRPDGTLTLFQAVRLEAHEPAPAWRPLSTAKEGSALGAYRVVAALTLAVVAFSRPSPIGGGRTQGSSAEGAS
jgi:hypothetical protein